MQAIFFAVTSLLAFGKNVFHFEAKKEFVLQSPFMEIAAILSSMHRIPS